MVELKNSKMSQFHRLFLLRIDTSHSNCALHSLNKAGDVEYESNIELRYLQNKYFPYCKVQECGLTQNRKRIPYQKYDFALSKSVFDLDKSIHLVHSFH